MAKDVITLSILKGSIYPELCGLDLNAITCTLTRERQREIRQTHRGQVNVKVDRDEAMSQGMSTATRGRSMGFFPSFGRSLSLHFRLLVSRTVGE
jgi:hypothetical protein